MKDQLMKEQLGRHSPGVNAVLAVMAALAIGPGGAMMPSQASAQSEEGEWSPPELVSQGARESGTFGIGKKQWGFNRDLNKMPEEAWGVKKEQRGKIVRVNLLKIKPSQWQAVPGIRHQWPVPKWEDSRFAWHPTRSDVRDVDGDGKRDMVFPFGAWHFGSDQMALLIERPEQW